MQETLKNYFGLKKRNTTLHFFDQKQLLLDNCSLWCYFQKRYSINHVSINFHGYIYIYIYTYIYTYTAINKYWVLLHFKINCNVHGSREKAKVNYNEQLLNKWLWQLCLQTYIVLYIYSI